MKRGQVIIEFALLLPVLLMLMVGGFYLGSYGASRTKMQQAAYEGAVAGAQHLGNGIEDCNIAETKTRSLLNTAPTRFDCKEIGQDIVVTLGWDMPVAIPFVDVRVWPIDVTGSAVVRSI